MQSRGQASFGTTAAVIGTVLIACGIAWLLAENWHIIPSFLKIIILLSATGGTLFAAVKLKENNYTGIGESLFILGSLLYTLSIFLIAQIYATDSSMQGFAFLLLLCWIGVFVVAYVFNSPLSIIVGAIELVIWQFAQHAAFSENSFSMALMLFQIIGMGMLFCGAGLLHREKKHPFSPVYGFFTAFYFLILAYILSFQMAIPHIWEGISGAFTNIFAIATFIMGAIIMVWGLKSADLKERLGLVGIVLLFIIFIFAAKPLQQTVGTCYSKGCYTFDVDNCPSNCMTFGNSCTERACYNIRVEPECVASDLNCAWDNASSYCMHNIQEPTMQEPDRCNTFNYDACTTDTMCQWSAGWDYGSRPNSPLFWFLWFFANIVFLGVILVTIAYGYWKKIPSMVNIGMVFFALMILTRYIGFTMDFWEYTKLSVIFISGGILLILGSWGFEKARRKLVGGAQK
jgi:uncharacterized membrane protein